MASSRQATLSFPNRRLRSSNKTKLNSPQKIADQDENSRSITSAPSKKSPEKIENPDNLTSSPSKRKAPPPISSSPSKVTCKNSYETPRRSPKKDSLTGTPTSSAKKQLFARKVDPKVILAKQALSTSVPDHIVGRDKELAELNKFLNNIGGKTRSKKRSMYMSGPPGTGKTACLSHLLQEQQENLKFRTIFFNCMSAANSKDIFLKIALEFDGNYDGKQPQKYVEAKICAKNTKPILLVLDEVDQLDSKGQEILYSIFEWPYLRGSKLSLIGIANRLDLTDTVLTRLKMSEKLNPIELKFQAYSKAEIINIINKRLPATDLPLIKPEAVVLIASKVANGSGDIRKALDGCRRAIDSAELDFRRQLILTPPGKMDASGDGFRQIDLPQMNKICQPIFSPQMQSSLQNSNSDLPTQQKIILATLLLMTNYGKKKCKEVNLGKLHTTYERICKKRRMDPSSFAEVRTLCGLLEDRGVLDLKKKKKQMSNLQSDRDTKVSLRWNEDEIKREFKDKNLLDKITSDTSCLLD